MAIKYNINQNRYSVELTRLVKLVITLSNGEKLRISSPEEDINKLLRFIEDPKNRFLCIGMLTININQIVSTECSDDFHRMGYLPKNG
nr:MAG TPA: hypothetical protein [Caudoviricetes sp.]